MADDLDTSEFLDIDVDELAGMLPLIAAYGLFRVQAAKSREALTTQDAGHCGRTQTNTRGDLMASLPASAQPNDLLDEDYPGLSGNAMRARAAIDQRRLAGLSVSGFPLESSPSRDPGRLGGAAHGHTCQDPMNQQGSTGWASSGILVKLHLGSFGSWMALNTSSLTDLGPDGQQTLPVNNVLRNES
jgi:hypothetical protein